MWIRTVTFAVLLPYPSSIHVCNVLIKVRDCSVQDNLQASRDSDEVEFANIEI